VDAKNSVKDNPRAKRLNRFAVRFQSYSLTLYFTLRRPAIRLPQDVILESAAIAGNSQSPPAAAQAFLPDLSP